MNDRREVSVQWAWKADEQALVLAPNILRTTSDSLVTVYTNAAFESKWILTLLQALQKEHLDKADWPEVNF